MEETCQKCGHTRYAGDLFDGGCDDCCDWMVAKLAELTAERESLSQDRNHWAQEARLMAEKVKPLEDERDALKAKVEAVRKWWREYRLGNAARPGLDAILNDAREGGE